MKSLFLSALLACVTLVAHGQLVTCRPKLCMIEYGYHNDSSPNSIMTTIKNARPDILIDNTPGGYYGQLNGGVGCLPPQYTALGIQVFCYLVGGYEGTMYGTTEDNLNSNLARIDAVKLDGATGIFLDQVSNFPGTASKAYISAIYAKCVAKNLKLILNPGTSTFDSWLMSNCDYLLSDEHYDGSRSLSASEAPYASRILVVAYNVANATTASNITLGARTQGFGYSYACYEYISLPSWLSSYLNLITQPITTPTVTSTGGVLQSSAPYGNQWYKGSIPLTGETNTTYRPTTSGSYYTIVTLNGCASTASNNIAVTATSTQLISSSAVFTLYPNPASHLVTVNFANAVVTKPILTIHNLIGDLVLSELLTRNDQQIDVSGLPNGIYLFTIQLGDLRFTQKLFVRQ